MSDYETYDEVLCPKCGAASANHDTCDRCGALISKIRDREKSNEWEETAYVQNDSGSSSLTKKLLITLLVLGMVGFGYFMYKRSSPGGNDSAFVFSTFTSSFTQDVLEHKDGPVVVDFYATWCGPCKILAPEIEKAAQENSDIKFMKVDVDNNQDLTKKYHISVMPTLVVFKDGREVGRHIGVLNAHQLKSLVERSS